MKTQHFRVGSREKNASLLDFLSLRLGLSRKKAKQILDARRAFVNGGCIWMARHRLSPGDSVEVLASPPARDRASTELRVLLDAAPFVVLDKPSGMLSNGPHSVETLAREQLGRPSLRVAHRLDRHTTGCLIATLNDAAFERLVSVFRERRVAKTYRAIVAGHVRMGGREIATPLDGRQAKTRFEVLDAGSEASYLLVSIKTGRTHQIRRHLAQLAHPVLGDREHGMRKVECEAARHVPRQMLHAAAVAFTDPDTRRHIRAASPLPADFKATLKRFGLDQRRRKPGGKTAKGRPW